MTNLKDKCTSIRIDVLKMLNASGSGHSGGSLSAVEILVALYYGIMNISVQNYQDSHRDRFILSKGHAAPLLYAILADKGFFPKGDLSSLRKLHSNLQGHPDSKKVKGVEASTGSLGQGSSIAVGMALAAKSQKLNSRVFALLGDGELQEGQVWEAFMFASAYKLDNLTFIIDYNKLQLDGPCNDVLPMGDIPAKMKAFGFAVHEIQDGNNIDDVVKTFALPKTPEKPTCIIAHTIKGKGVSFIEGNYQWHGRVPNDTELIQAIQELEEEEDNV